MQSTHPGIRHQRVRQLQRVEQRYNTISISSGSMNLPFADRPASNLDKHSGKNLLNHNVYKADKPSYPPGDPANDRGQPSNGPVKDELFLQTILDTINNHLDDPALGKAHLSKAALRSYTQVFRKLKAQTGENPSGLIRRLRLHKALQLLQTTDLNISEIAYTVGLTDPN